MRFSPPACSDDRLALARRGGLSSSDLLDFATHLVSCADCRIAWRLSADFEGSAGPAPGDERIIARAAKAALASTPRVRVGLLRVASAAAAAMLVAAGVASAAIALHARYARSVDADAASAPAPKSRRKGDRRSSLPGGASLPAGSEQAPADGLVAPVSAPVVSGSQDGPGAPTEARPAPVVPRPQASPVKEGRSGPRQVALVSAPSPSPSPSPSRPSALEPPPVASSEPPGREAATIAFARAVDAREQGRIDDAIASFRALQSQYPGTPEALVSLVSLGELCLRTGAASEALASFTDYARNVPDGALAPEALAGHARALASLGRTVDSEAIWRELARRFPASPYARRAVGTAVDGPTP
jgi:TolA-binding protein